MIGILVIDLGGVVAEFLPERRLKALAELSALPEAVIAERIFGSGLEEQAEAGLYTLEQTLAAVQTALEDSAPQPLLIDAWSKAFDLNVAVLDVVSALPVPAALFTNNGPMLDACMDGPLRPLRTAFNEIICSRHIGARKPEREAFRRAAARLGSPPDSLLLLDDSGANVEAAREEGWNAEEVRSLRDIERALDRHAVRREPER